MQGSEDDQGEPDEEKLEQLVKLTEEAKAVADSIGAPVARAAYHLEAARQEAEAVAGNEHSLTPRPKVDGVPDVPSGVHGPRGDSAPSHPE